MIPNNTDLCECGHRYHSGQCYFGVGVIPTDIPCPCTEFKPANQRKEGDEKMTVSCAKHGWAHTGGNPCPDCVNPALGLNGAGAGPTPVSGASEEVNGKVEVRNGETFWMGTKVHPCPMCGVCPTNVDDCGAFGNPDCPYFGIGTPPPPPTPAASEERYQNRGGEIWTKDAEGWYELHARAAIFRFESLEKELAAALAENKNLKTYAGYKDETATVFMNQVKKLQAENARLKTYAEYQFDKASIVQAENTRLAERCKVLEERLTWKPIETAPEGTHVLIGFKHSKTYFVPAYKTIKEEPFLQTWRHSGGAGLTGTQAPWPDFWVEIPALEPNAGEGKA